MAFSSDLARLGALLVVSLLAASRAARLELDAENRALRSTGTPEARTEERRAGLFGREATLVLLLVPTSGAGADAVAEDAAWVAGLRARAEVADLVEHRSARPGERLLALTLSADAGGRFQEPLAAVVAHAEETRPDARRLYVSGAPAAEAALAKALRAEERRIVPLVALVLLALLALLYRSPVLALGALLPALSGIAMTGALQQALGYAVDPVTSLLPPVLLVVGIATGVHLIEAYLDERRLGHEPEEAARDALRHVLVPSFGCAVTTVIGFLALLTNPMPAVRRFGILSGAGVLLTALVAFVLVPSWLRLFARAPRLARRAARAGPWPRWSVAMTRVLARAAPLTALGTLLLALFFGWAWTRLEVDTDPLGILPEDHPFRVATDEIGARLGGTEVFELLLDGPAPPAAPIKLLELEARLCALDGVVGPAGVPRRANDGSALCSALLAPAGTTARERLFATAEDLAHQIGWSGAHATGLPVRTARDSGALARGERQGLLASLLTLLPCVFVLRSARLTAIGMAANALPCFLLHGGLALAGRPLSVASAMIGSVVLGLVVDDALYFLHGYRAHRATSSAPVAVARTIRARGQAMTITTLVLTAGFLASLAGHLATTREFGVLAAGAVASAWVANLLLVPSFLLCAARARPRCFPPARVPESTPWNA